MSEYFMTDSNLKELHELAWGGAERAGMLKAFFYWNTFSYIGEMDTEVVNIIIEHYKCFACVEAARREWVDTKECPSVLNCAYCPCDWGEGEEENKLCKPCEQVFSPYSKYVDAFYTRKLSKVRQLAQQVKNAWVK